MSRTITTVVFLSLSLHQLLFFQEATSLKSDDVELLKEYGIKDFFTDEEKEILKTKRIRREVRDLSFTEWESVSNAMNTMKTTDTATGQELYGSDYISYDELVCWHTMTAWSYSGDLGHGVPHFGMWHRAFMLLFENSLLSIDSSISAFPYWDYRIDTWSPRESRFFSELYIGDLMGDGYHQYAIKNGPFAYWPIAFTKDLSDKCVDYGNVFGLMRTRVNPNPSKYVTRMGGMFCEAERNEVGDDRDWGFCLDEENYEDFIKCYEGTVHGGAHLGVGGTVERWNLFPNEAEGTYEIPDVDHSNVQLHKWTWCHTWLNGADINEYGKKITRLYAHERNNCFICPKCDLDDVSNDGELLLDCVCKLTDDFDTNGCELEQYNINQEGENEYLNSSYSTTLINNHLLEHAWGDMLDSVSSVNDPIFFFHHFNMDRYTYIWQLKNFDNKPYYGYPEKGYEYGINLYDVSSPERPFLGTLFRESYNSDSIDPDKEMTFQDIFDATTFVNAPYIYDDMWQALFGDEEDDDSGEEAEDNESIISQLDVLHGINGVHHDSLVAFFILGFIFAFVSCIMLFRLLRINENDISMARAAKYGVSYNVGCNGTNGKNYKISQQYGSLINMDDSTRFTVI